MPNLPYPTWCPALLAWFTYLPQLAEFVVDDFGDLAATKPNHDARLRFVDSAHVEQSAFEWEEADRAQKNAENLAWAARRQCPPRIRATILEPEQDYAGRAVTTIEIDDDATWQRSPLYSIDVARADGPLLITHAQLAALLAAGEALCKPAPRRRNSSARGVKS